MIFLMRPGSGNPISLVLILFILMGACSRPTPQPPIPSPVPLATPSSSKIESTPKKELKTSRLTLREIKSFSQIDPEAGNDGFFFSPDGKTLAYVRTWPLEIEELKNKKTYRSTYGLAVLDLTSLEEKLLWKETVNNREWGPSNLEWIGPHSLALALGDGDVCGANLLIDSISGKVLYKTKMSCADDEGYVPPSPNEKPPRALVEIQRESGETAAKEKLQQFFSKHLGKPLKAGCMAWGDFCFIWVSDPEFNSPPMTNFRVKLFPGRGALILEDERSENRMQSSRIGYWFYDWASGSTRSIFQIERQEVEKAEALDKLIDNPPDLLSTLSGENIFLHFKLDDMSLPLSDRSFDLLVTATPAKSDSAINVKDLLSKLPLTRGQDRPLYCYADGELFKVEGLPPYYDIRIDPTGRFFALYLKGKKPTWALFERLNTDAGNICGKR